jgi:hypothetical protein
MVVVRELGDPRFSGQSLGSRGRARGLREEPRDQPPRRGWGQQRVARRDDPDGVEQVSRLRALAEEAAGPGPQRRHDVVFFLEGGQHEHLHSGQPGILADQPGRGDAVNIPASGCP